MSWKNITSVKKTGGLTPWVTPDGDRAILVHDSSGTVLTPEIEADDHHEADDAQDALEKFYDHYRANHGLMRADAVDHIRSAFFDWKDRFHAFRPKRNDGTTCDHCGVHEDDHIENKLESEEEE